MNELRPEGRGRAARWSRLSAVPALVTGWLLALVAWVASAAATAADRDRRGEEGFTVAEALAMAALGVVTIVGFWALMKALGVEIIDKIRENILGGGS